MTEIIAECVQKSPLLKSEVQQVKDGMSNREIPGTDEILFEVFKTVKEEKGVTARCQKYMEQNMENMGCYHLETGKGQHIDLY